MTVVFAGLKERRPASLFLPLALEVAFSAGERVQLGEGFANEVIVDGSLPMAGLRVQIINNLLVVSFGHCSHFIVIAIPI